MNDLAKPDTYASDDHFGLDVTGQADSIAALDAAFAEAVKKPDEAPLSADEAAAKAAEAEKAAEAAKTAKVDDNDPLKAAEDEAAKATEAEKAAEVAKTAEAEAAKAAEAEAAKPAEASTGADEVFDKIELPPHTSTKAKDAFSAVKKAAKEQRASLTGQVTDLSSKLEAANKQVQELSSKQGSLPENIQKELEELRRSQLAHDVESDPTFREHDSSITANTEAIYKRLEAAGMSKENVQKMRDLGGPANVEWEPILEKLPFTSKTYIQGKLVENETLQDKKAAALEKAKANASEFMKERSSREANELTSTANSLLKQLEWTAEKQVPASAKPEEKATIEAGNKVAREAVGRIKEFLADRSPGRFAELAVGTAIAYKLQAELESAGKQITSLQGDLKTKVEALTKERDALQAKVDSLKKAEVGPRRGDSSITPPRKAPPQKGEIDLRDSGDAFAQYEAEAVSSR